MQKSVLISGQQVDYDDNNLIECSLITEMQIVQELLCNCGSHLIVTVTISTDGEEKASYLIDGISYSSEAVELITSQLAMTTIREFSGDDFFSLELVQE